MTVHNFDDLNHYDDIDNVAVSVCALDMVVSNKTTVPLISRVEHQPSLQVGNKALGIIITNPVGPSIDIFERNTWEPWDKFLILLQDILKLKKIGVNNEENCGYTSKIWK